jgi:hypothetical protein
VRHKLRAQGSWLTANKKPAIHKGTAGCRGTTLVCFCLAAEALSSTGAGLAQKAGTGPGPTPILQLLITVAASGSVYWLEAFDRLLRDLLPRHPATPHSSSAALSRHLPASCTLPVAVLLCVFSTLAKLKACVKKYPAALVNRPQPCYDCRVTEASPTARSTRAVPAGRPTMPFSRTTEI